MSEMNDQHDERIESMLRRHLREELAAHAGDSSRRFAAMIASNGDGAGDLESNRPAADGRAAMRLVDDVDDGLDHERRLRLGKSNAHPRLGSLWVIGVVGTAMAALLTIVSMRHTISPQGPARMLPAPGSNAIAQLPADQVAESDAPVRNVQWDTIDQGLVQLDDGTTARRLLQTGTDTVKWYDPKKQKHFEYTVPRRETVYVAYERN